MSNKNAVGKPLERFENNLVALLDKGVDAIPDDVNANRLKINALMAIGQDDKLLPIAKQQPAVVAQYVYNFIIQGLDMLNREAYIVPYKGKLEPIIDYRGEKKIAMQYSVKPIKIIKSGVVYEKDEFEFLDNGQFRHHFNPFTPKSKRGDMIGAYCSIIYEDGSFHDVFVEQEEIQQVKDSSPSSTSKYSPWNNWEEAMWEKTAIRKAMNRYVNLDFSKVDPAVQEAYLNTSNDVDFGNNRRKAQEVTEEVDVFDVEYSEQDEELEEVVIDV